MSKVAKPFKYRGRWRMTVTLDNGTRPTKDFERYADAVQWGAEQLANANSEHEPVLGGPTQATLAQALNEYARVYSLQKGGVSAELTRINRYLSAANLPELAVQTHENGGVTVVERTRRQTAAGFRGHLERRREQRTRTNAMRDELALRTCNRITTKDLRDFQSAMKEEGLSDSTAQKELAMLKTLFNVAAREWEWHGFTNPCASIKLGKSQRRFVKLSGQERDALMRALAECENPYFWPLVFVAKETTLRRKTLLKLRWSDVDLDERTMMVDTKTGQKVMALPQAVQEALHALARDSSGLVFPLTENAVTLNWKRVRERAGLPDLQYRDMRHLGATDWVRRGLGAHALSKVLGHASITTAQKYVDMVSEDVRRALDAADMRAAPVVSPPGGVVDAQAHQKQLMVARLQRAGAMKRAELGAERDRLADGTMPDDLDDEARASDTSGVSTQDRASTPFGAADAADVERQPMRFQRSPVSNVVAFRRRV